MDELLIQLLSNRLGDGNHPAKGVTSPWAVLQSGKRYYHLVDEITIRTLRYHLVGVFTIRQMPYHPAGVNTIRLVTLPSV